MAINRADLYAPVSNVELADGRALSSRIVRDWGRQLNNMKSYALAQMLIPNNPWPAGFLTAADTTAERFITRWSPVPFPSAFTDFRFMFSGRVRLAADSVTLRLYMDTQPYIGGDPIDSGGFSDERLIASITVTSTTNIVSAVSAAGFTSGIDLLDGSDLAERNVHLTLTKQALDASDQLYIINVAAWPLPTAL